MTYMGPLTMWHSSGANESILNCKWTWDPIYVIVCILHIHMYANESILHSQNTSGHNVCRLRFTVVYLHVRFCESNIDTFACICIRSIQTMKYIGSEVHLRFTGVYLYA